jgi:hypothetical protein
MHLHIVTDSSAHARACNASVTIRLLSANRASSDGKAVGANA